VILQNFENQQLKPILKRKENFASLCRDFM
jgi:hypothetical protein